MITALPFSDLWVPMIPFGLCHTAHYLFLGPLGFGLKGYQAGNAVSYIHAMVSCALCGVHLLLMQQQQQAFITNAHHNDTIHLSIPPTSTSGSIINGSALSTSMLSPSAAAFTVAGGGSLHTGGGNSYLETIIMAHTISYFIVDLLFAPLAGFSEFSTVYCLHHIASIFGTLAFYLGGVGGYCVVLTIFLCEITNPLGRIEEAFLRRHDFSREARESFHRRWIQRIFYTSFILLRCCYLPVLTYRVHTEVGTHMGRWDYIGFCVCSTAALAGSMAWCIPAAKKLPFLLFDARAYRHTDDASPTKKAGQMLPPTTPPESPVTPRNSGKATSKKGAGSRKKAARTPKYVD